MKQLDALISLYKPQIKPKQKSISELYAWLNNHLDIDEFPLTEFSNSFVKQLKLSAAKAITNAELNLAVEQLQFVAYRLLLSEKNSAYNEVLCESKAKFIYVIFEKRTGYISTNNSQLLLELSVEQGISQYDYDNTTSRFLYYITCVDRLAKKEY